MRLFLLIVILLSSGLALGDDTPQWSNKEDAKYAGYLLSAFFNNNTYNSAQTINWGEVEGWGSFMFTSKDMQGVLKNSEEFGHDKTFFGGMLHLDFGLPEHLTFGGRFSYLPRNLDNGTPDYALDDFVVSYIYAGLQVKYSMSHLVRDYTKGYVDVAVLGNYNYFGLYNHKRKKMRYHDFSPNLILSMKAEKTNRFLAAPYLGISPIFSSFSVKATDGSYEHHIPFTKFRVGLGAKFYLRPAYLNLEINPISMPSYAVGLGFQIVQ